MEKYKLPLSGSLVGALVAAFDLRNLPSASELTEILGRKTSSKYFDGEWVTDDSVREILKAFAGALIVAGVLPAELPGTGEHKAEETYTRVLLQHVRRWDDMAGELGVYFPVGDHPCLSTLPYLRLMVIDLALRLAAFSWLTNSPPTDTFDPSWARECGRSAIIHDLLARAAMTRDDLVLALDKVAEKNEPPFNTVDRWLSHEKPTRPTARHLKFLAEIFGAKIPGAGSRGLFRKLLLHYALCDLGDQLAGQLGRRLLSGLATALNLFHFGAFKFLEHCRTPADLLRETQSLSLLFGAGFAPNAHILRHLWRSETTPGWRADLQAAAGGIGSWKPRIEYCLHMLPSAELAMAALREAYPEAPEDDVLDWALGFSWSRFEDLPEEHRELCRSLAEKDPRMAAAGLETLAHEAVAQKDFARSAKLFGQAALKEPNVGRHHFNKAVSLSFLRRWREALNACHIAMLLDPDDDRPLVQIGNILLQSGRENEAFDHMESGIAKLKRMSNHYAFHLGLARLAVGQVEAALKAFEEARRLEEGDADALDMAAQCFLRLGNRAKAREYAKKAHHLGCSETWNAIQGEKNDRTAY